VNFEHALSYMPHSGPMRLIQQIVSANATSIQCVAVDHNDADFALRLEGVLYTVTLAELGAQAASAHASLFTIRQNHTGLLVALQNLEPTRQSIDDIIKPLSIVAEQLHADANGSIYRFCITGDDAEVLTGQATLKMKVEPE
jgi:predicted hotdog family 3-hydroxylacyl-ACP dehydratase